MSKPRLSTHLLPRRPFSCPVDPPTFLAALPSTVNETLALPAVEPNCSQPTVLRDQGVNASTLSDALLHMSTSPLLPPGCLEAAQGYIPACYGQLSVVSGCCSVACRTAIVSVSASCSFILAYA